MTHDSVFQSLVDQGVADLPRWGHAVLREAAGALAADGSPTALAARAALERHGREMLGRWADELHHLVAGELAPAGDGLPRLAGLPEDWMVLDTGEAEQDIELRRCVDRTQEAVGAVLQDLQDRLGRLQRRRGVRLDHPMRPEIVTRALRAALARPGVEDAHFRPLLQAMTPALGRALRGLYQDQLATLGALGVSTRPAGVGRLDDRGRPAAPPDSGFDVTRPGALGELRGDRAALRGRAATVPTLDLDAGARDRLDAALLRALRTLPVPAAVPGAERAPPPNLVRQHLGTLEGATRHAGDRDVIHLVMRLLDALLQDHQLLPGVRHAIARLQTGLLRLALFEPALLEDHQHPCWTMLNRIGAHTVGFSDERDPRLTTFLEALHEIIDAMTAHGVPGVPEFRQGQTNLEALIAEELACEGRVLQPAIERLRLADRREQLRTSLRQQLLAMLVDTDVPAPVRDFLMGPWLEQLGQDAAEGVGAVPEALAWAERLVGTLRPLRNATERSQFLRTVPAVVRELQAQMTRLQLPGTTQRTITEVLMARHTAALRRDLAEPLPDPASPQALVRRLLEEEDRPAPRVEAGDSLIDEHGLATVPAPLLPAGGALHAPRRWLETLQQGPWCLLCVGGAWTTARLLWISESRRHWLFSDARPLVRCSFTRAALERLVQEGLARPLETRNLLERAVDALMQER
jgi:hypothetical protein